MRIMAERYLLRRFLVVKGRAMRRRRPTGQVPTAGRRR